MYRNRNAGTCRFGCISGHPPGNAASAHGSDIRVSAEGVHAHGQAVPHSLCTLCAVPDHTHK